MRSGIGSADDGRRCRRPTGRSTCPLGGGPSDEPLDGGKGANRRREGGIGYRKCGDETAKLCENWNELVKWGPLRQRG